MRSFARPARLFIISAVAALGAAGCSRSEPEPPQAGLGAPRYERDGPSRWSAGASQGNARQWAGPPGSPQQFQSVGFDTVYFNSDSAELTREAQRALTDQAAWLRQYPTHAIMIEGHADERGTREYNIALGQRRAHAVKNFLAANGVNAAAIRAVTFGKERPVASCNDISCWSKNRRAQSVLSPATISRR